MEIVAVIVSGVVGMGGLLLGAGTFLLSRRDKQAELQQKEDQMFYETLDWMSGRTQRRNLGITAMESRWRIPRFRELGVPMLCSSAVYLLTASKQRDSGQERFNLRRIMSLLLSEPPTTAHVSAYREVQNAIKTAQERAASATVSAAPPPEGKPTGVRIEPEELKGWQETLAQRLGERREETRTSRDSREG
jgi:hypothetical protein